MIQMRSDKQKQEGNKYHGDQLPQSRRRSWIDAMTMTIRTRRDLVPNLSIEEYMGILAGRCESICLLNGEHWLPGARGNFLDGVEDDAIWVDRNATRLDEVEASTGDTSHEGLQGDSAVITIDGDFVSQSRISGPDDPHVEVSPAVSIQGPRTVGLVTGNADVVKGLVKADTRSVGTLGLELQGHEATEAIQEGGRGAGPVIGGGTTKTTRSPARSGVAAGVSGVGVVVVVWFLVVEIRRERVATPVSWSLVHLFGVQTNGLHGGGIVWVGTVAGAEGLPTATKTTAERAVAVRIVLHRRMVAHYRKGGL